LQAAKNILLPGFSACNRGALWYASSFDSAPPHPALVVGARRRGDDPIRGSRLMADWRKLSLALVLADGKIDEAEVKILRRELYADGKVDREEVDYLVELRTRAQRKAKGKKISAA